MSDFAALQARLGYKFCGDNLLRLALTHPSVAHESGVASEHNQRLEFLGDAVLQLVLTQKLYEKFPAFDEGVLTKARAKLVNRGTLAEHARALDLGAHLILSRGEETSGGRERASALADAFESLLGAIFLDGGFDAAREFILREFAIDFGTLSEISGHRKSQGRIAGTVAVTFADCAGIPDWFPPAAPDHDRDFECAVPHEGVGTSARSRAKAKKPPKATRRWRR